MVSSRTTLIDRKTFEVELPSEPSTGCGITIVGSRSSGIAIKSLLVGGVAHVVSLSMIYIEVKFIFFVLIFAVD